MTASDKTPGTHPPSRRGARLRMTGILVLALGIGGAGIVYWLGTRSPDFSGDPSMQGYNRAESRQMGMLYGKQGLLIEEWSDAIKQPATQATIILVVAALGALGCFYFARLLDVDDEPR